MTQLTRIRDKVRQLTGRKSTSQLSNEALDLYINDYYQDEFPQELRLLNLREQKRFILNPNVSAYNAANQQLLDPNTFYSVEPPAYCDNYPVYWTQSLNEFYGYFPRLKKDEIFSLGDGSAAYSATLASTPILPNSLFISGQTGFNTASTVRDDGSGNLITDPGSDNAGSVDYETGDATITNLGAVVPSGNEIRAHYYPYSVGRPLVALWWDNELTLYPVPDRAYEFQFVQYVQPTQLLNANDAPDIRRWWEAIAYGAAMKVFEANKDMSSRSAVESMLDRKLLLIQRQTWNTLSDQRTPSIYEGDAGNYRNGFFGHIPGLF